MRYTVIAGTGCSGGSCPTVYSDSEREDDVIVQGYVLDPHEAEALGVPAGETVVRVPRSLLEGAVRDG